MSTTEEASPLGAAPDDVSRQPGDTSADAGVTTPATDATPNPSDTLSPAVRRLVRQFDLDITGIHGTGPSGRIRVGDVMGLLAGRTDTGNRDAPARTAGPEDDAEPVDDPDVVAPSEKPPAATDAAAQPVFPTTTVFDCDMSRVLSHRKKLRLENVHALTTSYILTALADVLDSVPEITTGHPPRYGVSLTTPDGELRSTFLDTSAVSWDSSLDERVRAVDAALRANLDADVSAANLLVHQYGESGSLLATPTPIGPGHAASVGIGRVRREIVVRTIEGVETPRVAAQCYLSVSFFGDKVPLHHANRALAAAVAILETWPE
jgi:2-oxoglutarate dehydrogenase E2 component (dihydrolipoamide succinyltransferase)